MEFDFPEQGFLQKIRELCTKHGAIYILDEMITGFRLAYPGAHKMLGVEPDMTTWGKGVANGFSLCVLAGKREIMRLGGIDHTDRERVFLISTTHGAETHTVAAGLATLRETKRTDSVARNSKTGLALRKGFEEVIKNRSLQSFVKMKGHENWQLLQFFDHDKKLCDGYKTLVFQEFVKHGVLFRGMLVPTISHSTTDVQKTIDTFDKVLGVYASALEARTYKNHLVGAPVKPVFRKWNEA